MKKINISGLGALLLFSACSQSESPVFNDDQIRFSANYPGAISSRVSNNRFENGDIMGIYMTEYVDQTPSPLQLSGNFLTNVPTVYNGYNWQCTPAMYWGDGKYDIYAYYPYDGEPYSVDEYKFTIDSDQSVSSGYEASDFLWAKASGVERMDMVPLSFNHSMSKLVVKLAAGIEYEGELPNDAKVVIHNTVPTALIDLSTGLVNKDSRSSEKSIIAQKNVDGSYSAIIVPQRIQNHIPLIEIICNDVSYLVESAFIFRPGVQHTVTVTLDSNPDKVRIQVGGEIQNWN